MTCVWCNKKGLLATSGNDGTIRVWNVTKKQYSLQQTCVFNRLEGDAEESLGSPSDPSFSPVSWSISGKYLAGALEKMVNIWQVNGKSPATVVGAAPPPPHLVLEALASLYLEIRELFYENTVQDVRPGSFSYLLL